MAGVDLISHLPDEIIHHILSFLYTTKLRVQTSALSKRWREIWTHHLSLELKVTKSGSREDIAGVHYVSAVVSCVISFRAPSLHQLSVNLWFPSSYSADHCATASHLLLQFAGRRSVRILGIHILRQSTFDDPFGYDEDDSLIPDSLYCCTSLVHMGIICGIFPSVPVGFGGFRCLKSLHLERVTINTDEVTYLLGYCNRLETVRLVWCPGFTYLAVASRNLPQLTDLTVHFCNDLKEGRVEATHLHSIAYGGDLQGLEFYTSSSPVLYQAALCQVDEKAFDTQERFMNIMLGVQKVSLLVANDWFYQFAIFKPGVLYNLQKLTLYINHELTESALKVLITNIGEFPMLETLDMLVWSRQPTGLYQDCSALPGSLRDSLTDHTSPPCRKCSSALFKFLEENAKKDWRDLPELVPNRSLPNLKTLIMRQFLGSNNEMHLVKFLLGNGVALEKFLVFDFPKRSKEMLEELFAPFPRASSQVQLKLSSSEKSWRLMSHSWLFVF